MPPARDRGQWLYRAELERPGERLSLRLLLRLDGARSFDLTASDALGQQRWRVWGRDDRVLLLDPVHRRFCPLDGSRRLRLDDFAAPLPVVDLPRVLRGEIPASAGEPAATAEEDGARRWFDAGGGRWDAVRDADGWKSWTAWSDGRPVLWFRREGRESALWAQEPAFRLSWREVAAQGLPAETDADADPAAGFVETECPGAATS
ncbi:MAG: hypothetical protein AB7G12_08390 [Thermoanaerobaculia bacterium]